jgi:type IV secretion system protein VirB10
VWERPLNPLKVIYSSQLLHGMLEQNIVTGESSTVRVRLTQTLYDKFGQGQVLMPMDTQILANVDGNVRFGQTRVPIKINKAELPDGTDINLSGKVGDAGGAVGVPGDVDNKYGQVVFAAILTTGLSVGSRYAGGNPSGFQPTIEQDFARDASQSVNASGQKIIERSLSVQPVISVPIKTPVTIELQQNISLQTAPVIIRK